MIELSLVDVKNIHKIIQTSVNRGTYNADELSGIIRIYEGLTKVIFDEENPPDEKIAKMEKPKEPATSTDELVDAIIK